MIVLFIFHISVDTENKLNKWIIVFGIVLLFVGGSACVMLVPVLVAHASGGIVGLIAIVAGCLSLPISLIAYYVVKKKWDKSSREGTNTHKNVA